MITNTLSTTTAAIYVKPHIADIDFNLDWKSCSISEYKKAIKKRANDSELYSYVGYDEDEWYKD